MVLKTLVDSDFATLENGESLARSIELNQYRAQLLTPISIGLLIAAYALVIFSTSYIASIVVILTLGLVAITSYTIIQSLQANKLYNLRSHILSIFLVISSYGLIALWIFNRQSTQLYYNFTLSIFVFSSMSILLGFLAYSLPLSIQSRKIREERLANLIYRLRNRFATASGDVSTNRGLSWNDWRTLELYIKGEYFENRSGVNAFLQSMLPYSGIIAICVLLLFFL